MPIDYLLVVTHVCALLRDGRRAGILLLEHEDKPSHRLTSGNPLVSRLRYASQALQIRSQYIYLGNYRLFHVI